MTRESLDQANAILEERWERIGFDSLPREERDYVVLWFLRAEVNNGGFHQYFFNSSGDTALEALAACDRVGATATHRIVADALSVFDAVGGYTTERSERYERMPLLEDEFAAFRSCTDAFYSRSEDILALALRRVHSFYVIAGLQQPCA